MGSNLQPWSVTGWDPHFQRPWLPVRLVFVITLQTPLIDAQSPVSVPALCATSSLHPIVLLSPLWHLLLPSIPRGHPGWARPLSPLPAPRVWVLGDPTCPCSASTHSPLHFKSSASQELAENFSKVYHKCCMDAQQTGAILLPEMVGKLKKDGSAVPNGCQALTNVLYIF